MSGKSIQTIRRMIKQKKIQVKRQKTPQGFNYLVAKDTLLNYLNLYSQPTTQAKPTSHLTTRSTSRPTSQAADREHRSLEQEVDRFTSTIQKLIGQHDRDKENLYSLLKAFQEKVVALEEQIKLLEAPRKKHFWQFWG